MKYDISRNAKTLELDKILELLSLQAGLADTAENALSLTPSSDFEEVKASLDKTNDAYIFMSKYFFTS